MNSFNNIKYCNNLLKFNQIFKSKESFLFSSNINYHNSIYKSINENNNIIISHNCFLNKQISHINFIENYNSSIYNINNIINILITETHKCNIEKYDLIFYSTKYFNEDYKQFLIKNNIISNTNLLINIIYFNIYTSTNKLYIFDYKFFLLKYDNYDEYIYNYNLINNFIEWSNNYIKIVLVDSDTLYRIHLSKYKKDTRELNIDNKQLNILIKNKQYKIFLNKLINNFKLKIILKTIINYFSTLNNKNINNTIIKNTIKNTRNINTKIINKKNINKKKNKKYDDNNNNLNSINY